MKKPIFILFVVMLLALPLTGCTSVKDYVNNQMLQKSGMLEDGDYLQYTQYQDAGQLDYDGYYVEETTEETIDYPQVLVTFCKNSNLELRYYADEAHRVVIEDNKCYLNPGQSVHVVVSMKDDVFSSMYSFSGFRIYEYNAEGERKLSTTLVMESDDDGYVLRIPDTYEGTEISIEPTGEYQQRSIALNDYYTDDDGNQNSMAGTWTVNEKDFTGDVAEISPMSPYIVSYSYDSDLYFYISSSPDSYYVSNDDGIVVFNQCAAEEETVDYSVELHEYLSVTLVSDKKRSIWVNNGDKITLAVNEPFLLEHLKYGDTVTILTDKEWPELENYRNLVLTDAEPDLTGYCKYTLCVPEKDGEFVFNPSDYSYDHGSIRFTCIGQTVTTTQILEKGRKIYYEQVSADDGYWLSGRKSDHYIVVGDEAETDAALRAICFTPMVDVTVDLPQPEAGGSIIYSLDGARVYDSHVSTHSGAVISMKFEHWEGWMCDETGECTYTVTVDESQTVEVNGADVDTLFTEDDAHKPKLSLKLEKSVEETMEFTLEASGYRMDVESYGGGWKVTDLFNKNSDIYEAITNTQIIVSDQKIGTDQPINITMAKRAIQAGKAVRMVITMTDSEGNETSDLRYINDLGKPIDPIYIYTPGTNAKSTAWYDTVEITIGVVPIEEFTQPAAEANTKITVKNQETNSVMSTGTLIEADTKVVVTIAPLSGYYVTGKNVSNDVYSKTMKFSEYQKNIRSIVTGHPAAMYCKITLDQSDSFATYTYKLDGKKVAGTINAKAGQKLELTYEITDPAYKLSESHGGIAFGIGASDKKATEMLVVTTDLHGQTVTKSDFNIETVKGG